MHKVTPAQLTYNCSNASGPIPGSAVAHCMAAYVAGCVAA